MTRELCVIRNLFMKTKLVGVVHVLKEDKWSVITVNKVPRRDL